MARPDPLRKIDSPVFRSNFFGLALASLSLAAGLPWPNRLALADKVGFFARQPNRKVTDRCAIDLERQSFVGYLKAITTSKRMTGCQPFTSKIRGRIFELFSKIAPQAEVWRFVLAALLRVTVKVLLIFKGT